MHYYACTEATSTLLDMLKMQASATPALARLGWLHTALATSAQTRSTCPHRMLSMPLAAEARLSQWTYLVECGMSHVHKRSPDSRMHY